MNWCLQVTVLWVLSTAPRGCNDLRCSPEGLQSVHHNLLLGGALGGLEKHWSITSCKSPVPSNDDCRYIDTEITRGRADSK